MREEPNWDALKDALMSKTLKELAPIRKLYGGMLGGASGKANVVSIMVSQLQHMWRDGSESSENRVNAIIAAMDEAGVTLT